jgi:hypothetical protein
VQTSTINTGKCSRARRESRSDDPERAVRTEGMRARRGLAPAARADQIDLARLTRFVDRGGGSDIVSLPYAVYAA